VIDLQASTIDIVADNPIIKSCYALREQMAETGKNYEVCFKASNFYCCALPSFLWLW